MANRRDLLKAIVGMPAFAHQAAQAPNPFGNIQELQGFMDNEQDNLHRDRMLAREIQNKIEAAIGYGLSELSDYSHMRSWSNHMRKIAQRQDLMRAHNVNRDRYIDLLKNPDKLAAEYAKKKMRDYPDILEYIQGKIDL